MLLALDTATQNASIALYDGQNILAEMTWRSQRRHTVELAPQVDNLLRLAGVAPAHLTALGVSIGPGSYTGTRIAISYAKGIALARALPLIGIPTLDALARPHLPAAAPICALAAAGRGRFCWATYAPGPDLNRLTQFGLARLPEICAQTPSPAIFVGELTPADVAFLHERGDDGAFIPSPALSMRRAGVLAELAWQRLQAGDVDDPAMLSPIYLA